MGPLRVVETDITSQYRCPGTGVSSCQIADNANVGRTERQLRLRVKKRLSNRLTNQKENTLKSYIAKHIIGSNCYINQTNFLMPYQQQRKYLLAIIVAVAIRPGLCVQIDVIVSLLLLWVNDLQSIAYCLM